VLAHTRAMSQGLIDGFVRDGFVKLEGAVPADVVAECVELLWEEIGKDPSDSATWTEPVIWVGQMTQPAFVQAMNVLPLLAACEWLAGPGRWMPRASMGSFPLRFPHQRQPDGLGWHVEGSYLPDGEQAYWANFRSRDRALLALFLFTDIDEADGPTRIRVGSHHLVPAVLARYGERGTAITNCAAELVAATDHCEIAYATGLAGDIYVCHPLLVHAAQANSGTRPRFLGQPAILANRPYRLDLPESQCSPVELTIQRGLRATP
jgi:hypothetical protein